MKTRIMLIFGIVVLFQCCQNEQQVDLDRALDIVLSIENKQLNEGVPNFLTLKMENSSDHVVNVPDSDLIIEFTSYSGSIRRVISLREIVNGTSDLESLSDLSLVPGEEKFIRVELGDIVFSRLRDTDNKLPADDYTINIFLTPDKESMDMKYADNIRSNYVDVLIYD